MGSSPISATTRGANEKFLQSLVRDNLGRITESDETVLGTTTTKAYGYSDSGFLKTVTTNGSVTERYGYDGNGNRTRFEGVGSDTASATYDDQDRMLRYKDTRYTYSAAGELATAVLGIDTTRYTYDPLGNLVTVVFSTGHRIDYLIDGRNRRVGRKFNGTLQKQWLYQDQLEPVAELDGSGALVSRFVYGTRSNVPDYMVNGGITYRIIADHLGSVRLVVNASSGAVAESLAYDAYGRLLADTSPGFQPFGYAGGLWDATTGLVRFGARDYDARSGRWSSRDPVGFGGGEGNLYAYVASEPINSIDRRGLIRDTGEEGPRLPPSGASHGGSWPHYGNWGGPGWRNGMPGSELDTYPSLPGQPGFDRPIDARDESYREHDTNLRKCAQIADSVARQKCRAEADLDLASSLTRSGDRGCERNRYITLHEQLIFWWVQPNGLTPGRYVP